MNLPERLKEARRNAGLKQLQVSQRCGIDDSSLSAFENDRAEPRLAQLDKLAKVYRVPLSYFFQDSPLEIQPVMWRNKPDISENIEGEFLQLCRQYRQLEIWTNEISEQVLPPIDTYKNGFGYPQVRKMASEARHIMGLGERPGESLYRVLEEVLCLKIFHLDLGEEGTAACAVSEAFGQAILLNQGCVRWRRNHDLAHELFHLLTWERFKHNEGICEPSEQEEKFATCFAGNLLLPAEPVENAILKSCDAEGKVAFDKLDTIAREFDVSLESLFWRMHFLFGWKEDKTKDYIEKSKGHTPPREDASRPPLFPERYRALAINALQEGEISLGRFAEFMKITRAEARQHLTGKDPEYAQVPAPAT